MTLVMDIKRESVSIRHRQTKKQNDMLCNTRFRLCIRYVEALPSISISTKNTGMPEDGEEQKAFDTTYQDFHISYFDVSKLSKTYPTLTDMLARPDARKPLQTGTIEDNARRIAKVKAAGQGQTARSPTHHGRCAQARGRATHSHIYPTRTKYCRHDYKKQEIVRIVASRRQ